MTIIGTGIHNDEMHAFISDEGLARFCTVDYQAPTSKNIKNDYMHLTNYSINKDSPNYIWEPENIFEPNNGTKRTLTSLLI